MPPRTTVQRSLIDRAGKHFVLFRMYQQGGRACLSPHGSPTIDVLVLAADERVIATLRVKTRARGDDKGWQMNVKDEGIRAPELFYAFVDMEVAKDAMPITYIIPASKVANMLAASHRAWLAIPNHRDSPARRVKPTHKFKVPGYPDGWMEQYREAWDRLMPALERGRPPLSDGEFDATTYIPALLPTPSGT